MEIDQLSTWIQDAAIRGGCNLVGFAEIDENTQKAILYHDYYIDESPANYVIVLGMALEDPIQDCWTQSPLWINGKNYIDEVIARIGTNLALKLTTFGYPSRMLKYDTAYLKILAIHAGLGIIGRNNLLITPKYGPHIRMRALITQALLNPSETLIGKFDPCSMCPDPPPCIVACPSGAFKKVQKSEKKIQSAEENYTYNIHSPQSGYDKTVCRNYSLVHLEQIGPYSYLWCRACEEACPIGKDNLPSKPLF